MAKIKYIYLWFLTKKEPKLFWLYWERVEGILTKHPQIEPFKLEGYLDSMQFI